MDVLDLTTIYPNAALDFEGRSVAALDRALVRGGSRVRTVVLKPWVPPLLARRPRYRHLAVPSGDFEDRGVEVRCRRYPHLPRLPFLPRLPAARRLEINARAMARVGCRAAGSAGGWQVIHAQGLPVAPAAGRVARRLDVPLAVTLRDDLGHVEPAYFPAPYRDALCQAAAVFVIGPGLERDLPKYSDGGHLRCEAAPNGVDVEEIDAILRALPARPGDRRGRLVSVANLVRWKGIHETLEALAELLGRGLGDWRYTVVGDGPFRDELEGRAAELGLAGRVTFRGRLRHAGALAEMWRAEIFVLPSFREAFGNVFAEAAVCGLPAIGCLDNGPEWIIVPGETGLLVPPRDVAALADALERLLRRPEEARKMGEAARRHVRAFTWDRTAALYLRTFADLRGG